MLFEIENGLAMVAELWNGRRLQSLHLRVHITIEPEVIEHSRNLSVGFKKVGVVVGDQAFIRRRVLQDALGVYLP